MARLIADGEVRIQFVPGENAIADPDAPTAVEINTGTDVTPHLASLDTPLEGEAVPSADLSSPFDKTVAGTYGGSMNGEFYRDDTADTAWGLFPRNTTGFFVIRRFGGSDVPIAATDEVEVWPIRVITRSPSPMTRNTVQMATVNFATLDEPSLEAVVA